jgi:NAD-dependent SIR2 family protein deacetylase
MNNLVQIASKLITNHKKLIISAGAGMSVESGLPDYRSNEGLYKHYPPFEKLGVNFQDCANPQFFEDHPKNAWYFYGHRYLLYKQTKPHIGYSILKNIKERYFQDRYFIYTSNVDGHFLNHFPGGKVIEIHGSINHLQCNCGHIRIAESLSTFLRLNEDIGEVEEVPICQTCKTMLRPNVLMFNDYDFNDTRYNEQLDGFKDFYSDVDDVVVIEIGAGKQLPVIRAFGRDLVSSYRKCSLIRINKNEADYENYNSRVNDVNVISLSDPVIKQDANNVVCLDMSAKEALVEIGKLLFII